MTLPRRGLTTLAVMFSHPSKSHLPRLATRQAHLLDLRYAIAAFVQRGEETEVIVRLVPRHGRRITQVYPEVPQSDTFLFETLIKGIRVEFDSRAKSSHENAPSLPASADQAMVG